MSRLNDILGVKEGQEFYFNGLRYKMNGNRIERICNNGKCANIGNADVICDMITRSNFIKIISEKITLTEQQITAIKGRIAEGTPWVARDKGSEKVWFYGDKPTERGGVGYNVVDGFSAPSLSGVYDFITFENSPMYLPDLIKEREQ